jgi:two-component system cell cycle sensor histidine kinase/response regulator CckA
LDIDEREKLRESLFESDAQKNAIVDGFTGILIFFNQHKEAKWANKYTYDRFPDVIGTNCHDLFCEQSPACGQCAYQKALKSGVIESSTRMVEGVGGDGEEAVFDMVASPVKDQAGEVSGIILIAHNVTEKYTLERQLRHTQKMEAIGTLAGGVAHDFNNVLTPIMGYSEIIRLKLQNDKYVEKPVYDYLEEILKAAKRAKSLVEQVLTFSRTMEEKAVLQYMHPIVKEVMKLMRVTLPSTIVITEEVDESCGRVLIDPVQMHQVLINLCTNASHSMGGKHGKLLVRLAKAERGKDGREWVELSVEDSGRGIEKDHLERIFEPYFSTKEKTSGTGMGLAMVHGIVNSQGGDIKVESEVGKGSIFRIYLPIADASTPIEQVAEIGDIRGGSGRILLVDDEAQVVQVTGEILKNLGYEVVGKTSSTEILEVFSCDPEAFDLLMTDLTMPGMTGLELSERVKAIRADIPIILFTGYSDQVSKSAAKEAGIDEYCMKPISMRALSNVVGKFLGEMNSVPFGR